MACEGGRACWNAFPKIPETPKPWQAFNAETGGPARCVEMAGWPKLESVTETFGATLRRALLEAFWATSTTEGVSVLFDRRGAAACLLLVEHGVLY